MAPRTFSQRRHEERKPTVSVSLPKTIADLFRDYAKKLGISNSEAMTLILTEHFLQDKFITMTPEQTQDFYGFPSEQDLKNMKKAIAKSGDLDYRLSLVEKVITATPILNTTLIKIKKQVESRLDSANKRD